jgi:RNA polymerase sigma-70 factor (ECF subfamily)
MAANPDPDAALMLRVKQGEREAFAELVTKYQQAVINLLARTVQDYTEAEDLAQNVFVQAYKAAHRYESSARFSTWLFTIARNVALNELRRRHRHPADSLDALTEEREDHPGRQLENTKTESPPHALLRVELEQKVNDALAELPENQRTAILLCREEELSYEDIAKVLGVTLSATKSLIHRGRETLRQQLKPYLHSGVWAEKDQQL